MLGKLFKLLELSGKESENGKNKLDAQISKSIEDFKNRPVFKSLNAKIIDTTSDHTLLQMVFDNLINKFTKDYSKDYQTVLSWRKGQQLFT